MVLRKFSLEFLQCIAYFALQKAISTTIREHTTDYWTELFIQ